MLQLQKNTCSCRNLCLHFSNIGWNRDGNRNYLFLPRINHTKRRLWWLERHCQTVETNNIWNFDRILIHGHHCWNYRNDMSLQTMWWQLLLVRVIWNLVDFGLDRHSRRWSSTDGSCVYGTINTEHFLFWHRHGFDLAIIHSWLSRRNWQLNQWLLRKLHVFSTLSMPSNCIWTVVESAWNNPEHMESHQNSSYWLNGCCKKLKGTVQTCQFYSYIKTLHQVHRM